MATSELPASSSNADALLVAESNSIRFELPTYFVGNLHARSDLLTCGLAPRSSSMGSLVLPAWHPGFLSINRISAGNSAGFLYMAMCPADISLAEIAMFSPLQPTYRAYS